MTTIIESVDNLPKPPQHDRVNEAEKSSPEDQRRQFKKALKESMQEDEGPKEDDRQADDVVIKQDKKDQKQDQPGSQQADLATPVSDKTDEEHKDKASDGEHIDLKA